MKLILFTLVVIILVIFLVGIPLWALIWGLKVKKKTGAFPWVKFLIIVGVWILMSRLVKLDSVWVKGGENRMEWKR